MSRVCWCASLNANEARTPTARCRTCPAYGAGWAPVPICACGQGFPSSIHVVPGLHGYHTPTGSPDHGGES